MVRRLDESLPVASLQTMDDQVSENTSLERLLSTLSWAIAGLDVRVLAASLAAMALVAFGAARFRPAARPEPTPSPRCGPSSLARNVRHGDGRIH